jgi:SAM-dependent methyltransferase
LSGADGYVTELPYTLGYYPELDPRSVSNTLQVLAVAPPKIEVACELGFGQGLSLAIHAVAGDCEWWGNDLLPAHLATVRELTQGLAAPLQVFEQNFVEFCARSDLPQFDFIGMHGVWSWISAENRACIAKFIEQRLAPRGVLYVSYNLREAWTDILPLREFLVNHAAQSELASQPLEARIEAALSAAQRVVAEDVPPARDRPQFEQHLRRIRYQRKAYLAHEYFNRDWQAFDRAEIEQTLGPLGLRYVGQAGSTTSTRFSRDLWVRDRVPAPRSYQISPRIARNKTTERSATDRLASIYQLNNRLLARALTEPYLTTLASPATGGGVDFDWRTLLALAAWRDGRREASGIADFIERQLQTIGHPLVQHGVVIRDRQEMRSILERAAKEFVTGVLPKLQELGIEPMLGIEPIFGAGRA